MIVLSGWLRFLALHTGSYAVVIASSWFLGAAGAVVITNYSNLPQRWFPESERTLATSVAVYTNYAAWALSALLVPMFVKSKADMDSFLLVQAIVASASFVLFVLVYRASPAVEPSCGATSTATAAASSGDDVPAYTALQSVKMLVPNVQYWLHTLCYTVFAGAGLSLTFVQPLVFGSTCKGESGGGVGLSNDQTGYTNFAFICTGVVAGVIAGGVVGDSPMRTVGITLRVLFALGTAAIVVLAVLTRPEVFPSIGRDAIFAILVVMMVFGGAATLGFQGLGLRAAVTVGSPVSAAYTGGFVMVGIQGVGAIFNQITNCDTRFIPHAAAAAVATFLLLVARFTLPTATEEPLLDGIAREP